jgi:hypothetical protein
MRLRSASTPRSFEGEECFIAHGVLPHHDHVLPAEPCGQPGFVVGGCRPARDLVQDQDGTFFLAENALEVVPRALISVLLDVGDEHDPFRLLEHALGLLPVVLLDGIEIGRVDEDGIGPRSVAPHAGLSRETRRETGVRTRHGIDGAHRERAAEARRTLDDPQERVENLALADAGRAEERDAEWSERALLEAALEVPDGARPAEQGRRRVEEDRPGARGRPPDASGDPGDGPLLSGSQRRTRR